MIKDHQSDDFAFL